MNKSFGEDEALEKVRDIIEYYIEEGMKEIKEIEIEMNVRMWQNMTASEMRLRMGEMTAQEIRTVRAVLNQILPNSDKLKLR